MAKIVIQDTADVILTDLVTGKVVLNAEAQLASISGSINEEDLYGGIGNKKLFKVRSQKDVNLSMRSAFADIEYWAMTQGVAVDDAGKATVTVVDHIIITENATTAGQLEIVIPNAPVTLVDALVNDSDGSQDAVTVTSGVAVLPTGFALGKGDKVEVIYTKEVTGNSVKIDATKFSNKYKVEYRTISYNPEDASVYSDIYFIFPETIPSGEFEISLENGSVYTPEISFSVMTPKGSNELGEIIEVVRP